MKVYFGRTKLLYVLANSYGILLDSHNVKT